jgi:single-strand DNA-binding protein
MNKVTLIGRVGNDPKTVQFENGKVVNLSIATSKKWKNKEGEKQEETQWHNVVIGGAIADVAEKYVKKGDLLALIGEIKYRSYEKDGVKNYVTEIRAESIQLMPKTSNPTTPNSGGESQPKEDENDSTESADDDLPF